MSYQEVSETIIRESIKSAIFIDDKAEEPFSVQNTADAGSDETGRKIYQSFADININTRIFSFTTEKYSQKKEHLFDGQDLVILDWKLQENDGEGLTLDILQSIVCKNTNPNFVVIYTSESNMDQIILNIISYFSNTDKDTFDKIKEDIDPYKEDLSSFKAKIEVAAFTPGLKHGELMKEIKERKPDLFKELIKIRKSDICPAVLCWLAFKDFYKSSEQSSVIPSYINREAGILVIEKTMILLANKTDLKPNQIISRMVEKISTDKNSYIKLLAVEFRNAIIKSGNILGDELSKISNAALLYNYKSGISHFSYFIKEAVNNQINLFIHDAKISLLTEEICDEIKDPTIKPDDKELGILNVFYNSFSADNNKELGFGDLFYDSDKNYYLCITALCDCLRPTEKIKNNFYFVKGSKMDLEKGLKVCETGFISYINSEGIPVAVNWASPVKESETMDESPAPTYIKPWMYFVKTPQIRSGQLQVACMEPNQSDEDDPVKKIDLKYSTTLKQNYAQRIANHAFMYPVRVGVDFVKK